MSSTTQVAVLAPLGHEAAPSRRVAETGDRPVIRLTAFAALGLYGVMRWGTLMNPAPTWRLLGLLALAVALAGLGPCCSSASARSPHAAAAASRSAPWARRWPSWPSSPSFPIAGVPLGWVTHLRVAVTADGIGQGLSALPGILVPYSGINEWARTVILLGAAVLLLDAGLLLAFAPPALGDIRRAGAALPLIALVVVPATLVHPHLAYLQGLLLFALLAFFMWGERVLPDRRGGVVLACAATGAIGMIVAPALDQHSPWIDYQAFTRGFTPAHVERFDWTQRYGPLVWPRTGNDVLDVHGHAQGLERRVLEGREPGHVRRDRLGRRRPRRRRAAAAQPEHDRALDADADRDDPRDADQPGDRRRDGKSSRPSISGRRRCPVRAPAPGSARTSSDPGTPTRSRCTRRTRPRPAWRARATPTRSRSSDPT